jgi:hypothetical protein
VNQPSHCPESGQTTIFVVVADARWVLILLRHCPLDALPQIVPARFVHDRASRQPRALKRYHSPLCWPQWKIRRGAPLTLSTTTTTITITITITTTTTIITTATDVVAAAVTRPVTSRCRCCYLLLPLPLLLLGSA